MWLKARKSLVFRALIAIVMLVLSACGSLGGQTQDDAAAGPYNQGVDLFNQGEYQQAIDAFDSAIELDPDFADAYFNRGIAHYRLGNFQSTVLDMAEAIRLDPNLARRRLRLTTTADWCNWNWTILMPPFRT
jgi:tetratricopeptide (TPR) repeat protein